MMALVRTGPAALELRDVPEPAPGAGEHVVEVAHVGICGSDLHAYLGHDPRRPAPIVLGHEAAGTVRGGPRDGERVALNPLVACGACPACGAGRDNLCSAREVISLPPRPGAFARYVTLPDANLLPVPDGVPLWKAALCEPIACAWHAVRLGLERGAPDEALVLGGGAIGLGAALALRLHGVPAAVVEPNHARRRALAARGFDVLASAEGVHALVIDAVGIDATRRAASAAVRPGGTIVHVGLGAGTGGLDVRRMTLHEIAFVGSYTFTARDFRDAAAALFAERLGPLDWTERRPLADGPHAFADLHAGRVAAPKIILDP